jgi:hypothetical protein
MAGFGFNLKLILCMKVQSLTESLGFLIPPHRQAAKRYGQVKKISQAKNKAPKR